MVNLTRILGLLALVALCFTVVLACSDGAIGSDPNNSGGNGENNTIADGSRSRPYVLIDDEWTNGAITSTTKEQYFGFTATASTQYLHIYFGGLTNVYVQLYDSKNNELGSSTWMSSSTTYKSLSVTSGQTYYVKVYQFSSYTGSYRIGFNSTPLAPGIMAGATTLAYNIWASGTINAASSEQWYKFTATTSTQYLHILFDTLTNVYVQLYDSNGGTLGSSTWMSSSTTYKSLSVTSGQTYYVKVYQFSSYTGSYRIGFNTIPLAPGILESATPLTANTWTSGTINAASVERWFEFTATTNTQYLHILFDTLTNVYVQLYDNNGGTLGSSTWMSSSTTYKSLSVTSGQTYYVKVYQFSSYAGEYKIAFSTSTTAPAQP